MRKEQIKKKLTLENWLKRVKEKADRIFFRNAKIVRIEMHEGGKIREVKRGGTKAVKAKEQDTNWYGRNLLVQDGLRLVKAGDISYIFEKTAKIGSSAITAMPMSELTAVKSAKVKA